jgi:radical SAM superfamily enzyme YgiQ (UPF0313 family)
MRVLLCLPTNQLVKDKKQLIEVFPNIGLAYIGAYLLRNGIDVKILDPRLDNLSLKEFKKEFIKYKPDIIGFSSYTEEIPDLINMIKNVKEIDKDCLTVLGGPHASALPIQTLKECSSLDVAVYGEGEKTLLEIANCRDLKNIKGIAFRKNGKIKLNKHRPLEDLNLLPFPAWELFDLKRYIGHYMDKPKPILRKELELMISTSRGCPYNCMFCFKGIEGYRFRDPINVVDELERDIFNFGAKRIQFTDATFGAYEKQAIGICNEIVKRGLQDKIKWFAGTRVDVANKKLLESMKKAGCSCVFFGVESSNSKILKSSRKNTTTKQVIKAFSLAKKIGLETQASFILGLPGETKQSILNTIKFAKNLNANYAVFSILVPFPGTKAYEMAKKEESGFKLSSCNWSDFGKQIGKSIELKNITNDELKMLQKKAYFEFYSKPSRIIYLLRTLGLRKLLKAVRD